MCSTVESLLNIDLFNYALKKATDELWIRLFSDTPV